MNAGDVLADAAHELRRSPWFDALRHHTEVRDYVTGDDTVVIGANRVLWTFKGRPVWDLPQLDTTQMELFVSARELIDRTINEPGWETLDGGPGWDTGDLWTHKLRESLACGFVDDIGREGVRRPIVLRVGHPYGYDDDSTIYTGDGHHRIAAAAVHDQFVPVVYSHETFATVNGDQPYGSVYADDSNRDPDADRCHYVPGTDDVIDTIYDYV